MSTPTPVETSTRPQAIRVHPDDNVAVALADLSEEDRIEIGGHAVVVGGDVPAGHKVALRDLAAGENVVKYGHTLGKATEAVAAGSWVHTHNLSTMLSDAADYVFEPSGDARTPDALPSRAFMGYRRSNGKVGTRNEVWVINTVGCVNRSAQRIARMCNDRFADVIDGVHSFAHPFGCSQLGDDLRYTQRVLAGLMRHPNAGGVLVIGLGCENNQMADLLEMAGDVDRRRIRYFNSQDVLDEVEIGIEKVEELVEVMKEDERSECDLSDLILGMKCGGSDAFSGLSANPLVGRIADRMSAYGATTILTEVPEMFGAEQQLMNRSADREVFDRFVSMINDFKDYFVSHGQPVYENPSPGNKEGGLSTLEEKSLGAVQKGGQSPVKTILDYGEPAPAGLGGLALLYAPGNDGVSVTAEIASGATAVLFTTGRGTPLGFPVPTLKISSNTEIFEKKPHWIDFNAGAVLDGSSTMQDLEEALLDLILRVASGVERAKNETNDYREIAIWKEGVTL